MMKRILLFCVLVTLVFAQETLTRIKIDRPTQDKLATLFEELPERIELYLTADSIYIVEATYADRRMVEELTADEYQTLLKTSPAKMVILENARLPHLIGQTLHGLGLYSWSLPMSLGMEDRSAVTIALFTPLVYTSAVFFLTSRMRVSGGAALGAYLGGIEGAVHGGVVFQSEKAILPVSLAENLADFALGQKMGFTPGMFQRKFNHCFYGYYHYFAGRTLAVGWENDDVWEDSDDFAVIGTALSVLEGYTSLFLSRHSENLTYGDALFELRTAIIGAELVPLLMATYDLHREERSDERIYAATSLAGYGLGYLLGRKLSRDHDLSGTAGVFTWLIPYLAHSATGGLIALTESEGLARSYPAIFLAIDLPLTCFCYKIFAERSTKYSSADVPDFNVAVNPAYFLIKDRSQQNVPIVSVSYRF
jgi:hypothetical protein